MQWFQHYELSEEDMDLLRGTPTMEMLQKHRLVIAYGPKDNKAKPSELGLFNLTGAFHMREINDETYELLFVNKDDLDSVEQHLAQFKMKQD